MTKDYTGPVCRALLEPNNNEGCIMRAAPLKRFQHVHRVKMGNLSISPSTLFGCLAISPFAEMIFDAGRMEDRPLRAKERYDHNYDYNQIAIRRIAPFDSEMAEDGLVEVSGELEILINSGQTRRNDPLPNGMAIANRSASRVGLEKVDSIVWDYAEIFRFRIVYELSEHPSDIDSDISDWDELAGEGLIDRDNLPEQLINTRRFGTTDSRPENQIVEGFRRTLHEPSSVGIILQSILNHRKYATIRPQYDITHSVNECLIQMKGQPRNEDCLISYISMALMPSRLPIPTGPFEGLEVMDPIDYYKDSSGMAPSFTATRKRYAPDMSHWIGPDHTGPEIILDVQFPTLRGPTFTFSEANTEHENLVSLTDKDDSLLGFARINERGHAFLCIPFDLEFTVQDRLINIRKGDYRIGIRGLNADKAKLKSLHLIHSIIRQALESIRFNPVSDRVKSISRLTNSTDDKTPISQAKIDHRLSKKTSSLTDDNILGSRNID